MRMLGAIVFASALSAIAACSSTTAGRGSGSSASGTVGAQCDAVGSALCTRYIDECKAGSGKGSGDGTVGDQCKILAASICPVSVGCGADTSLDACTTSFVDSCCTKQGSCASPAASTNDSLKPCSTALSAVTCADLTAGNSPAACSGVIQSAELTKDQCMTETRTGCCADAKQCDQAAQSAQSAIDECVQAVRGLACGSDFALPPVCKGVVKVTSTPVTLIEGAADVAPRFVATHARAFAVSQ